MDTPFYQWTPLQRLINDWCLDDNGQHMVLKENGKERFPDFTLYTMIAKRVHNHVPRQQLERPCFRKYAVTKPTSSSFLIDIDSMPSFCDE
jgi:hypothetical protein